MRSISLAEAKAQLSALVEQAAGGEPVLILRRGKPIAQITGIATTTQADRPGNAARADGPDADEGEGREQFRADDAR